MSNKFENWDDVNEYQKLHGVEPLYAMLTQGTLRPPRRAVVEHFLKGYEAATQGAKEREQAAQAHAAQLEQVALMHRQTIAAERQAVAAERGEKEAWWSARGTMWGVFVALVSIGVTIAISRCS